MKNFVQTEKLCLNICDPILEDDLKYFFSTFEKLEFQKLKVIIGIENIFYSTLKLLLNHPLLTDIIYQCLSDIIADEGTH